MAVQLPPLVQSIVLDPSGVMSGAGAITKGVTPMNSALQKTNKTLQQTSTSMNTMAFRAQSVGRNIFKFIGAPILAIGAASLTAFAKFEASMMKIEALVGVSAGAVGNFADAVKRVSRETGRGPQELGDAMFFVASAGLRGAAAMDVMEASAKGAAVGLGETKVVADAATSAVNAYGVENLNGGAAVDVLTAAVREGKVEADRLAPAIGKAIPVASAMGIQFHEVAAAIAAMTRTGTDARTSAIQLRQIMQSILDPSRQTEAALRGMGIAQGELAQQARRDGLLSVLKRLRDLSIDNAEAFADVFPNIRALAGAMDITGENLQENEAIFASLANSAGDTDKAFQKVSETAKFKFDKAMSGMQTSFIELGEAMTPMLVAVTKLLDAMSAIFRFFGKNKDIVVFTLALGAASAALGVYLMLVAKVAQAKELYALATIKGTAATNLFTFSIVKASKALWASPFFKLALISAGLFALGKMFGWFGKKTESFGKQLQDAHGQIRDVKNVAELSVKPMHDFAAAIRDVGAAGDELTIAGDFINRFKDIIEEAGDIDKVAGTTAITRSIIATFQGQGVTPENQKAIRETLDAIKREFGRSATEVLDPKIFGEGMNQGEIIDAILGGGEFAADADIRALVLNIEDELDTQVNNMLDSMDWKNTRGLSVGDFIRTQDDEGIEEALTEPVEIFLAKMKSGNFREAFNIIDEVRASIRSIADDAEEEEAMLALVDKAFMDKLHKIDMFKNDIDKGIDTVEEMMAILGQGDTREFLTGDFLGIDKFELFGETMVEIRENLTHTDLKRVMRGEMTLDELVQEKTIIHLENLNRELENLSADEVDNIADAFLVLETQFKKLDNEADKFGDRWDQLTGRAFELDAVQGNVNNAIRDFAGAVEESGGAMNNIDEDAIKARESFRDAIVEIKEGGETLVRSGKMGSEQAANMVFSAIEILKMNARAYGVADETLNDLLNGLQVGTESITQEMLAAADTDPLTDEMSTRLQKAIDSASDIMDFAGGQTMVEDFFSGGVQGAQVGGVWISNALVEAVDKALLAVKARAGISSPSKLFAFEVGMPIMEGIEKGIFDAKDKPRNAIRDMIESIISDVRDKVKLVTGAITASLDFADAKRKLDKAFRDFGAGGEVTKREKLTRRSLQRDVEAAKRALRLGQGHQEDLELALLDAQESLKDYEELITSEGPVARAQVDLMESGLDVAESQARMKMAGEDAITAFSSLASAIGMELSPQLKDLMEDTESLVGIVDENEEFFDRLFGEDVQAMIDAVAAGIGDIFEELEKDRDPLKFAFTGIDPEGNVHTTDMAQRSAADLISIWDSAPSMWGNNQQMPGFDSNFWKTVDFSEMYGPPNVNVDVAVNIAEGRTTVDTNTGVFANQKEAEADSKKTSTTVPRSAYNHRSGAGGWGGRFGW